jgi:hypothetical protein
MYSLGTLFVLGTYNICINTLHKGDNDDGDNNNNNNNNNIFQSKVVVRISSLTYLRVRYIS